MENNMTVACVGKTPVSVLQELLSRRGTTPRYELVQIEGAIHEPTFRYRVTVADVVAMGTGRSKKEAKHAAAKALLDKMIVGPGEEGSLPVGNNTSMPEVGTEKDEKNSENGENTESQIDKVDSAKEIRIMDTDDGSVSRVLNASPLVNNISENVITGYAGREFIVHSLLSKDANSNKRKFEESDDVFKSLKIKHMELSIELMKKENYLKSLEVLKLERDLGLDPSEITCEILERQNGMLEKKVLQ